MRAVIKYFCLKKNCTKDIHIELAGTLGVSAHPYSIVARSCKEFNLGRTSTKDEHREGRLSSVCTGDNVKKIENLVLTDGKVTIRYLNEVTGIFYGSIQRILTEELHMKKVSARWVPRMLTDDQKKIRYEKSLGNLEKFQADPETFLRRYVTAD